MGYARELFLDNVDEEFLCSICLDVLENPVQDNHDHLFCSNCINRWLENDYCKTCPLNRQIILNYDLKQPSKVILNLLSKLRMKCKHGCSEITNYERFQEHLESCECNPDKFEMCLNGCRQMIRKDLKQRHECIKELLNIVNCLRDKVTNLNLKLNEAHQVKTEIEFKKNVRIRDLEKELDQKSRECSNLKEKISNPNNFSSLNSKSTSNNKIPYSNTKRISNKFKPQKRKSMKESASINDKQKWNPSTLLN